MRRTFAVLFVLVMALKVAIAARLDLFGDEAFYWSCSRRLDIAYSDHPFVTALLVRGGTALAGDTPLGVRLLFLACGALLVPVVLVLARRFGDERQARRAALGVLLIPLVSAGTALAVPDGPLLLFAALALLLTVRATATGGLLSWLGAGLVSALALCTHYRGVLVPASALAYLLVTRSGRARWRTAGPWLASLLALAGLAPILAFNARLDWEPLLFQAGQRHAAAGGLIALPRHLVEQAVVVTPVLYAALLGALFLALRRGRAGDDCAALLACFALVPLVAYFLASPFTDKRHDYVHWPQTGYLPLLPLAPAVLDRWRRSGDIGRMLAIGAPALAALATLLLLADGVTAGGVLGRCKQFRGWSELADAVDGRLAAAPAAPPAAAPPGAAIVVADNYIAAAELQFRLGARADVFVLEHPLNVEHGRALQYRLWGRDERALAARAGEAAIVVVETSETPFGRRPAWREHVASLFEGLQPTGRLRRAGGVRDFELFEGRVAAP